MPAAPTSDSARTPPPPPPAGAVPAAAVSSLRPTLGDNVSAPRGHPCKACGSPVEPGDQFCHACGAAQPVDPARGAARDAAPQKQFRCQHCGAEVSVDANQFSFACPFCDSTYVLELPTGDGQRERPGFVIGFSIPPDKALVKFREWLAGGSWFHPGDLRSAQAEGKLRGVYLPFWSFSMLADSEWSAQIGEHWYRTETYTVTVDGKTETRTREVQETEWWPLDGKHHNYYSGYLVSGSKGLPQAQAERIKPYYLGALKRYALLSCRLVQRGIFRRQRRRSGGLPAGVLALGAAEHRQVSAGRHQSRARAANRVQPGEFRFDSAARVSAELSLWRQAVSILVEWPNRQDGR